MVLDTIITFLVQLLIGAFGIYAGGRAIANIDDYSYAIITALIGAIVWSVIALLTGLVSWIPLIGGLFGIIGSIVALVAWVFVINWRYPGSWGNAILIGLVAWVAVWIVQLILGIAGVISPNALGVPGI